MNAVISASRTQPENRILPATRLLAAIVVPILLLAFVILYFLPGETSTRFAWEIRPSMTAAYMGAGYLGGAYLFLHVIFGRRWHRVAAAFPSVTTFTVAMLLATLLHWSRFDLSHRPFQLWLGLYLVTPVLVPLAWRHNQRHDPGHPEEGDVVVPAVARWGLRLLGLLMLAVAVAGMALPSWLISIWPWTLTPLTARILSGWFALLAAGGLFIARDRRWSAWRIGLESIGLWHILVLVAAVWHRDELTGGLLNWYVITVALVVAGMVGLYVTMIRRRG